MMQRGADCRIRINGILYAAQRWMVGGKVQAQNVSNTEGQPGNADYISSIPPFTSKLGDIPEGTARLVNATFDDANNPFAAPLSLDIGDYVALNVFPAGLTGPSYDYDNVLITNMSHDGTVPGLQPITFDFESDGFFEFASS